MPVFPYLEILKKAYEITRSRPWLWIFGLFLGGVSNFNTSIWNFLISRFKPDHLESIKGFFQTSLDWGTANLKIFVLIIAAGLVLLFVLASLAALAYAAVIWSAGKLGESKENPSQEIFFHPAFKEAKKYFWRVIGLQISVTLAFILLFLLIASPIAYLFIFHAYERALVLLLLGLAILLPASLVFGFLHLYGPIFVVLYDKRIGEAVAHSFNLFRTKFKESLILAAFLAGLSLLFIFIEIFSIILFSVPVAILIWVCLKLGLSVAVQVLSFWGLVMATIFIIVLNAAFAAFQSVTWVLAVQEMVRTLKLQKEAEALAPEPA